MAAVREWPLRSAGGLRTVHHMEMITKAAWGLLALVHVLPALVLFRPGMVRTLYGVEPGGDVGVLIVHRGALFLAVVVASLWALADPGVRRAMGVVVGISVVGFLWVYVRAGMPSGALRTIAVADGVALVPLVWVVWRAWVV